MKTLISLVVMLSFALPLFASSSCNGLNEIKVKKIGNAHVRLVCIEGVVYIFSKAFGGSTVELQVLYSKEASESGKQLPKVCDGNHVE